MNKQMYEKHVDQLSLPQRRVITTHWTRNKDKLNMKPHLVKNH